MRTTSSFILIGLLVLGGASACSSKKSAPSTTAAPATPAAVAAPAAPAPAPAAKPLDPFQSGYCEVSFDGAPATKTPGGMMNISSGHWPTGKMKAPSWPLLMNCGALSLSASGKLDEVPMKASKLPIGEEVGRPGVVTPMMFFKPEGVMKIEAWDNSGIRGTFEFKGVRNSKATTVKGKFDFKCPYAARPGEPCVK